MLSSYTHENPPPSNLSSNLSSPAIESTNGRTIRCCAVCGDSPAKLHYGVLACFGCKGFFRRAVKEGRNKYICRYEKQCKVDKYERNTCRWCRFRKCLLVGMNPDSVRPDRNEANSRQKSRLTRVNSTVKSIHTSSQFRLTRQDSGRPSNSIIEDQTEEDCLNPLTPIQRQLLASITRLDAKCIKECNNQSGESVRNFTLKSLINERLLALDDQSRTYFENRDNSLHALWRIIVVVDWVNGICGMAVQRSESAETITVEDKIAIIQSVYSRLLVFRLCSQRVLEEEASDNSDLNLLRSFEDDSMFNSASEDIVRPLKKWCVSRTEILLIQAILASDPAIKGIRPAASDLLLEFRNKIQEILIGVMKRTHKTSSINAQFGNYLLLTPTILAISDRISTMLRQKFPLTLLQNANDPPHLGIIKTLAHPDTTDYLRFPQLNKKIFAVDKQESPVEKNVSTPTTYNNWHHFASAFTGIQMPVAYNTTANTPNFSIMSALSPNSSCSSLYSTTNLFPAQPLPEPTSSSSSNHSFITTTLAPLPPLTITAPTPPPTGHFSTNFGIMPFHTPPSDSDNRLQTQQPSHLHQQEQIRQNLDVPPSTTSSSRVIPKLPLQLTKSIEEMLRPTGSGTRDDPNFWDKPLSMDWADLKVSTPAFNQEVVAKFFPDQCSTTNLFKT